MVNRVSAYFAAKEPTPDRPSVADPLVRVRWVASAGLTVPLGGDFIDIPAGSEFRIGRDMAERWERDGIIQILET